jgi:hypothetical protein
MITWAKLALTAVQLVSLFLTWIREKQLIKQGEANVIADILHQQVVAIQKADEIRKRLDDDFKRDPASILRHDKYERPEG